MKAAILILLSFPLCVISATYSLPSYRSVDWSLTGVPGGPHDRTTIHATLTSSATAAQIASAIAACTSNQVVKLSAGTYTLSGDVTWAQKRGVTLRGDGKGQTILRFAASGFIDSQVGVSGGAGASLSAGVTKGSTTVTFSTTPNAGFAVDTLFLIQCSDNTNFVFTTTGIGSYVRSTHRITAVSGNDVTFTPPILHTMTGYSPVAFYQVGGPGIVLCGIEDMTIDVGAGVDGVLWVGSDRCWVKSCEITNFTNSGIAPNYAVQNSFLYNDIGTLTNWPNQTDGFGIYYYNVSCFNRDEGNLFNRVGVGRLRSNSSGNYGCFNVYTNIDFQSWAKHTAAVNGSIDLSSR